MKEHVEKDIGKREKKKNNHAMALERERERGERARERESVCKRIHLVSTSLTRKPLYHTRGPSNLFGLS